jgi:hypothetical protein
VLGGQGEAVFGVRGSAAASSQAAGTGGLAGPHVDPPPAARPPDGAVPRGHAVDIDANRRHPRRRRLGHAADQRGRAAGGRAWRPAGEAGSNGAASRPVGLPPNPIRRPASPAHAPPPPPPAPAPAHRPLGAATPRARCVRGCGTASRRWGTSGGRFPGSKGGRGFARSAPCVPPPSLRCTARAPGPAACHAQQLRAPASHPRLGLPHPSDPTPPFPRFFLPQLYAQHHPGQAADSSSGGGGGGGGSSSAG